jgi:hypothetical protein
MKRYSTSLASIVVALGICGSPASSSAVVVGAYDAAADFSTAANPNGVWSYGYSTTLGGTLAFHASTAPVPAYTAISNWHTDLGYGVPVILRNATASTVTNNTGTIVLAPGQLASHPGTGGEFSVVRFTAPFAGFLNVSGSFLGADLVGTTTDVHILLNGNPVFNGDVFGFGAGSGPSFNSNLSLGIGDHLDFVVGWGNGDFTSDATAVTAIITQVPEPTTAAMLMLGGMLIATRLSRGQRE